jgi:hypothetical protein
VTSRDFRENAEFKSLPLRLCVRFLSGLDEISDVGEWWPRGAGFSHAKPQRRKGTEGKIAAKNILPYQTAPINKNEIAKIIVDSNLFLCAFAPLRAISFGLG